MSSTRLIHLMSRIADVVETYHLGADFTEWHNMILSVCKETGWSCAYDGSVSYTLRCKGRFDRHLFLNLTSQCINCTFREENTIVNTRSELHEYLR